MFSWNPLQYPLKHKIYQNRVEGKSRKERSAKKSWRWKVFLEPLQYPLKHKIYFNDVESREETISKMCWRLNGKKKKLAQGLNFRTAPTRGREQSFTFSVKQNIKMRTSWLLRWNSICANVPLEGCGNQRIYCPLLGWGIPNGDGLTISESSQICLRLWCREGSAPLPHLIRSSIPSGQWCSQLCNMKSGSLFGRFQLSRDYRRNMKSTLLSAARGSIDAVSCVIWSPLLTWFFATTLA